jgi:surface polysaccharide O-acyltransferase-like enzyme
MNLKTIKEAFNMSKKGQTGSIWGVVGFIVAMVVIVVLLLVLFKVNESVGTGYTSSDTTGIYNVSQDVIDTGDEVSSNLPLVGTISIFAVIISLVVGGFVMKMRGTV